MSAALGGRLGVAEAACCTAGGGRRVGGRRDGEDEQHVVMDLVGDTVVAGANGP